MIATNCQGLCKSCDQIHSLSTDGNATDRARWLAEKIDTEHSIDIFSDNPKPIFETSTLWGDARGKMFGVLECVNEGGKQIFLYAFSGQYQNNWLITGWCPPLFDVDEFHQVNTSAEKTISALTREINDSKTAYKTELKERRKRLSQELMKDLHSLYIIRNFHNQKTTTQEAFLKHDKIPTGTGDCCAPKLLNEAIKQNLKPISIAEFFYGKSNKSGSKEHLEFYSSCHNKCQPLLGYMLCGLQ